MKALRALAVAAGLAGMTMTVTLALPAIASATASSQAQEAAEAELQRTYGSAWLERVPTWSVPECEEPRAPGEYQCMTEFEYAGTWHSVDTLVKDGSVTATYPTEWVREWHPNSNRCDKPLVVAGYLSSNRDGCDALLLYQNFGLTPRHGHTIRYTGFKKHLYFYGTGTALWPDFFGYTCQKSQGTYECANKFGDGIRWKPSPARHGHKRAQG